MPEKGGVLSSLGNITPSLKWVWLCQNCIPHPKKHFVNFRNTLLALVISLLSRQAAALLLGESQGIAVLGEPLSAVFEVRTDEEASLEEACLQAQVLFGNQPLSATRTRLTPLPGRPSMVRLQTFAVVDEPIVTVELSAGCHANKIQRTYRFLSNLPGGVVASASPLVVQPPKANSGDGTKRLPTAASTAGRAPANAMPQVTVVGDSTRPMPTHRVAANTPAVAKSAERSRLVMDILPTSADGQATSDANTPQGAVSPVALVKGKALQTSIDPATAAMLTQLKAELATLRAESARMQAVNEGLRTRQEQTDAAHFPAEMVYALVAALTAVLAALAWLWRRTQGQGLSAASDWKKWVKKQSPSTSSSDSAEPNKPEVAVAPPQPQRTENLLPDPVPAPLPIERVANGMVVSMVSTVGSENDFLPAVSTETAAVNPAPVRVIHPEEIFDLQQQAEFFVSVGEHEQAIEVMQQHIAENEASSPLAYLDLLRLYHSLSRVEDFKRWREKFQQHFNAQVPDFVGFYQTGRTLLDYPDALARIEAEWSSDSVVSELEACLFRREGTATEPFDLAAYDDLLLLYAVAQTTPANTRGAPPPRVRTTPEEPEQAIGQPATSAAAALESVDAVGADHVGNALDMDMGLEFSLDPPGGSAPTSTPPAAVPMAELVEDSDALLEFDVQWTAPQPRSALRPNVPAPAPAVAFNLDLAEISPQDVAAPLPSLTAHDLPPAPVTPPPSPGQAVGFGSFSDRFTVDVEAKRQRTDLAA